MNSQIEVIKTTTGFRAYGRFGAMMDADKNGFIKYCNLNSDAEEFKLMRSKIRTTLYDATNIRIFLISELRYLENCRATKKMYPSCNTAARENLFDLGGLAAIW